MDDCQHPSVLPAGQEDGGMVIDASPFPASSTLGLEVSIVNGDTSQRTEILGFPVVQRHCVSNGAIVVEIEAFVVEEETTAVECEQTGFTRKSFDVNDKHYILFRQELSLYSPEGTMFGVFLRPVQPFTPPLVSRLQSASETDDELWQWAEDEARTHAGQSQCAG
jgi:hypothetical protein